MFSVPTIDDILHAELSLVFLHKFSQAIIYKKFLTRKVLNTELMMQCVFN